jgi:hypothetical protein
LVAARVGVFKLDTGSPEVGSPLIGEVVAVDEAGSRVVLSASLEREQARLIRNTRATMRDTRRTV